MLPPRVRAAWEAVGIGGECRRCRRCAVWEGSLFKVEGVFRECVEDAGEGGGDVGEEG